MSRGATDDGISLLQAVTIEVGLIVGGALFSLTGIAAGIAGPSVVLAFAVAFAIAILGLVPTAMLGATFPTTGGNYRYPAALVSRPLAFLSAWGLGISMLTGGLPLYALTAGQYLDAVMPVSPVVVGFAVLTLFFLVNLVGLKPAATLQVALFVGLVAAMGTFVAFGAPTVTTGNLTPAFPNGAIGAVTAAGVLYFVCLGANFVVDIGGEIRDATVTIPQSFAVSVPIVLLLYVSIGLVAVGSVGADAMAGETLAVPAETFLSGPFLTLFVVGGALFAIATSVNAVYMIAPKYLEVLAEDGLMPTAVSATNDRYDTPHWALTVVYVLSTAALVSPLPIGDLGALLGLGGAFLIVPVMLAAIVAIRTRPGTTDTIPLPGGAIAGMAVLAVPLNILLLVLLASQSPLIFAAWLASQAVGGAYYLLWTRTTDRATNAPTLDT
ncbi:amino acid transporter [Salinarchaeum sp. Harcht-Bsk1]|uniref:APC family permease n=1 Tax=Salinarchaeum sp. Harcht-Bsk1 TaxID=1333523 RepID=UPI00034232DD|nr:APC family permease [Salinarchaeum sp. Harcht-Bsk1]AGN02397.1 amino acid transporter [Salinarchaeum sp. Harcht-Bsk1]